MPPLIGRHAGDASVWLGIATMLATVDFSHPKDDQGNVIDFTPQFNPGLVRYVISSSRPSVTNSSVALAP
jgi:hypothetical protein